VEFPRRRAHGIFKEGAPSVRNGAAKCGRVGCHLSTHPHMSKTKVKGRRVRHLSKRGAPPKSHVPISSKISTQSIANQLDFVSFDSFLIFAFNMSSILSTHIFFIFDLADFY
jgi:hypothetical protein